jgi:hypothetical protein
MPGGQARRRGGGRRRRRLRRAAGETLAPPNRDPSAGGRGRGGRGWTYMRSMARRHTGAAIYSGEAAAGGLRKKDTQGCAAQGRLRNAISSSWSVGSSQHGALGAKKAEAHEQERGPFGRNASEFRGREGPLHKTGSASGGETGGDVSSSADATDAFNPLVFLPE